MSEIKGQLLGVILVLIIFAAVSTTMGLVFSQSVNKVSEKYSGVTSSAETQLTPGPSAAGGAAFPGLSY